MKKLFAVFTIIVFFVASVSAAYQYKGRSYEYKIHFDSYKVVKNESKVVESASNAPLTFYVSNKGYATITYGKHERTLRFSKSECYIDQSLLSAIILNGNNKKVAHLGYSKKFLEIKENGYTAFYYEDNGDIYSVFPTDFYKGDSSGALIYAMVGMNSFMTVEGKSESMSAQARAITTFTPKPVSGKNLKAKFSISGTIRQVTPIKSPYGQLARTAKGWGEVFNGCFNNNYQGALLYGGTGYTASAEMPLLIKRAFDVCNKNGHNMADVQVTDGDKFVFLAMDKASQKQLKQLYIAYNVPAEMTNALETLQNMNEITFFSASVNDKGNWSVTSDHGWYADDETAMIVEKAQKLYGEAISIYMTNIATVVCCINGVYCKNVPSNVYNKLLQLDFQPLHIKFTDLGLYLITEASRKYVTNL